MTQAQADAMFLGERLAPVRDALLIALGLAALLQQNLWLAAIYTRLPCRSPSRAMLIAALAMSGSSVLVTLNALRARGRGGLT